MRGGRKTPSKVLEPVFILSSHFQWQQPSLGLDNRVLTQICLVRPYKRVGKPFGEKIIRDTNICCILGDPRELESLFTETHVAKLTTKVKLSSSFELPVQVPSLTMCNISLL